MTTCFSEQIGIIQEILRLNGLMNKYDTNRDNDEIARKYMDLYSKAKDKPCECFRRFVFEEVINNMPYGHSEKAYRVFKDLLSFEKWKTSQDKTDSMYELFDDFLSIEYRQKIFKINEYGYHEVRDEIQDKDEKIKEYINQCNRIMKIQKDAALEHLCRLYIYYYKDPIKARKYAIQIDDGDSFKIDLCEMEIIKAEKEKYFSFY